MEDMDDKYFTQAAFCDHANEVPTSFCRCPDNCYCRASICKTQGKTKGIVPEWAGSEDFGGSDYDTGFETGWDRIMREQMAEQDKEKQQTEYLTNSYTQPAPTKKRDKDRKVKRREAGLCVACGSAREPTRKSLCSLCADVSSKRIIHKRDTRESNGSCRKCDSPRVGNITHCEKHWLIGVSVYHFNTVDHADILKSKLEIQSRKCYYTGLSLMPGINASLDHVVAESIDPSLKTDINNVVWCDKRINEMKTNFSVDEFLTMCHLVSSRSKMFSVTGLPGVRAQRKPVNVWGMPEILDLVKADLGARTEQGIKTYGTSLKPFNGRDSLVDAYHEILDLTQYIRQELFQRDGK